MEEVAMYSILNLLRKMFHKAITTCHPDIPDPPVIIAPSTGPAAAKGIDYQCNSVLPILQIFKAKGNK